MTAFLRRYPLLKVIVLNVFAVLAYDTVRQPSARSALLAAARSMTAVQSTAGDSERGLPLPFP